nr:hypothetical protein [Providencia rettgeri]
MSTETVYRELRKVYQDNAVGKGRLLLDFIKTIEKDVVMYNQLQLEAAERDQEISVYDKVSDQLAESTADLRKAQESIETAIFFIVKALHHGNAMDLLNLEVEYI